MRRRWVRRRLRENRWRWIYCSCRNKFVSPVDTAPRAQKILRRENNTNIFLSIL